MATYRPDIILHFAAIIPAINSKKQLIYDVNVRGTLNLLQFAKQNGTKKFIISNCAFKNSKKEFLWSIFLVENSEKKVVFFRIKSLPIFEKNFF